MRQFVQELLVLGDFSTFILNGWGREKKMRRKVKLLNKIMNTEDIYSTNGQDQRKSWEGKMEGKKKTKKKNSTGREHKRSKQGERLKRGLMKKDSRLLKQRAFLFKLACIY